MCRFCHWCWYILLMSSQIWSIVFMLFSPHLYCMSLLTLWAKNRKQTNMQNQKKNYQSFVQMPKNQQLSAVQSALLQTVLNASAHAVASLGGKLWLLSVRSVVPSPAKSLKGGQKFWLQNLKRLPVTSTFSLCELSFDCKVSCAKSTACAALSNCLIHIFQQFNTRKAANNPFKLGVN